MRSAAPAQKPTGDPSTDLLPDRSPSAPRRNGCPTFWAVSRPVLAEPRCGVIARYRRTGKSNEEPLNVTSCGWSSATRLTNPTISSLSERSPTCGSDELASPRGGLTPRPRIEKLVLQVRTVHRSKSEPSMSALGHSRPRRTKPHHGPCPLRPESGQRGRRHTTSA